jgi:hypothetical protein
MFSVQEIPVVIEPGVAVLETSIAVSDSKAGTRTVTAHFFRLTLDEKTAPSLPLVVTTQQPHVFAMNEDNADKSPLLLVYDLLGRLSVVYTRDARGSWERKDVIAEHAGKAVTQFSIRFCFGTSKDRNKFLSLMGNMVDQVKDGNTVSKAEMTEAVALLARSRVPPVVLPVAVDKARLKNVRV